MAILGHHRFVIKKQFYLLFKYCSPKKIIIKPKNILKTNAYEQIKVFDET